MDRNPPAEVKRRLRREVNFGCPVPGCGDPFLTWHHFDPPWHVRHHHNTSGMIALCTKHHPMADAGVYSREQLQRFKNLPNSVDAIASRFEWIPEHCLIRLGGCYAFDWCRIAIRGATVLEIAKMDNDLTATSFILQNDQGSLLAQMDENLLTIYPEKVHDLVISSSGTRVTIWSEESKVGFDFRYSRKSPEEVEKLLVKDYPQLPDWMPQPLPIVDLSQFYKTLSAITEYMPEVVAIGMTRNDPVGTMIRWHTARHIGGDGRVPVMDFVSCSLSYSGRRVELRNGRLEGLQFCGGNTFTF